MEHVGAISEGEWSSFSGMYSNEEADFMAQLLGNCSFPKEIPGVSFRTPSTYWPDHESTMNIAAVDQCSLYSLDSTNISMHCLSQGSFPTSSHESYYPRDSNQILLTTNSSMSTDYCVEGGKNTISPVQVFTDNLMEGDDFLNHDVSSGIMEECGGNLTEAVLQGNNLQLGREPEMPIPEPSTDNKVNNPLANSNKRSCNPEDVQKNKRNVKLRKNQKLVPSNNNDEDKNAVLDRQSSTCRGSVTDPQSLYARRRREKINERLRILQTLVPNGTKVDISTMLEEAVQYVKFLQLQIKLLSSDDLWKYAPLAYNGMDIGLDLEITMPR